jgi:hypothetical protein
MVEPLRNPPDSCHAEPPLTGFAIAQPHPTGIALIELLAYKGVRLRMAAASVPSSR